MEGFRESFKAQSKLPSVNSTEEKGVSWDGPSKANLLPEYKVRVARASIPAVLEMLTIIPDFRSLIEGRM